MFAAPLTIEFNNSEIVPFRVILKCEVNNVGLQQYQRPITSDDGLLFSLMSSVKIENLKRELVDYKNHLQRSQSTENTPEFQQYLFEATCKIFLGTQYLGGIEQKKQKIKIDQLITENSQKLLLDNNEENEQIEIRVDDQPNRQNQINILLDNKEENEKLQIRVDDQPNRQNQFNNPGQQQAQQKENLIVCALYEQQTMAELKDLIKPYSQKVINLIIFVNGFDSMHSSVLQYLKTNYNEINEAKEQNKYSINNALFIQYSNVPDLFDGNLIFVIKYNQINYLNCLKWIYEGIATHFDPTYLWVTKLKYKPLGKAIDVQISLIKSNKLGGLMSGITYKVQNKNCFSITNTFWLCQTQNQLEQTTVNSIYQLSLDHNPLFCFYNWQVIQQCIPQYLQKINEAETDPFLNNLVQDVNFLLPLQSMKLGIKFNRTQIETAETNYPSDLSCLIDQQKRYENAIYCSNQYFWKNSDLFGIESQIYSFGQLIQFSLLCQRCLSQMIENYFGLSAILYLIFQSSYQLINQAETQYDQIISILFPYLSIISIIVFVIFTLLFYSDYKMMGKSNNNPILLSGKLVFYLIKQNNKIQISFYCEDKQQQYKTKAKLINQTLILNIIEDNNVFQLEAYQAKQLEFNLRQKSENFRSDGEYFCEINQQNLKFEKLIMQPITEKYQKFFYVGSILNFILIVLFIINISYNYIHNIYDDKSALTVTLSICLIIGQKICTGCLYPKNLPQVIKGYFNFIFYYLVISFGMKFYRMYHLDRTYENKRIDKFYHFKVTRFAQWLTINILITFMYSIFNYPSYFMVESSFNYKGYILVGLLVYYALQSLIIMLCQVFQIFNDFTIKRIEPQLSKLQIVNNIEDQLRSSDFNLSQFPNLLVNFMDIQCMKVQVMANEQCDFVLQQTKKLTQERKGEIEQQLEFFQGFQQLSQKIKNKVEACEKKRKESKQQQQQQQQESQEYKTKSQIELDYLESKKILNNKTPTVVISPKNDNQQNFFLDSQPLNQFQAKKVNHE